MWPVRTVEGLRQGQSNNSLGPDTFSITDMSKLYFYRCECNVQFYIVYSVYYKSNSPCFFCALFLKGSPSKIT